MSGICISESMPVTTPEFLLYKRVVIDGDRFDYVTDWNEEWRRVIAIPADQFGLQDFGWLTWPPSRAAFSQETAFDGKGIRLPLPVGGA
jgi:hypothetical protein